MNEDVITDLKQFISATVTQATSHLATKADLCVVKADISVMKTDLRAVKISLEDTNLKIDTIAETLNESLDDHEHRLTKLEVRTT